MTKDVNTLSLLAVFAYLKISVRNHFAYEMKTLETTGRLIEEFIESNIRVQHLRVYIGQTDTLSVPVPLFLGLF